MKNTLFDIRSKLNAPAQLVNSQPNYGGTNKYPGNGGNGGNGGGMVQMPGIQQQPQQLSVADQLNGPIIVNPTLHHDIGGVSQVSNAPGGLSYFTMIFDNSAGGAPVRFAIGCDNALALAGLSALPVATGGSNDVAAINQSFFGRPMLIGSVKYETSSDQAQFSQEFLYHMGVRLNGANSGSVPYPFQMASRPTYENDLLLIIQAQNNPWRFGQEEFSTITVLDGEIVTLTFGPAVTS